MLRKLLIIVAALAMLALASMPVLAQVGDTGDAPVSRPNPDDPYRIFISNDQAVYCGHGVVGDPITEFCIENGITPPVLYDVNGNLIAGSGTNTGIQYDNSPDPETPKHAQLGDCWYNPDDAIATNEDGNIPIIDTPCGIVS